MEEHEPDKIPPRWPPEVLNYRTAVKRPFYMPMVAQVAIGFAAWIVTLLAFIAVAAAVANMIDEVGVFFLIALFLAGISVFSFWMRIKHGWRGFIPGVLIGFGLTILLPLGMLAIYCGQWG